MFKLFYKKKEDKKESKTSSKQSSNIQEQIANEKSKRQNKIHPSREDGGPSTISKLAQEKELSKPLFVDILKKPASTKLITNIKPKINKISWHKIKEFVASKNFMNA